MTDEEFMLMLQEMEQTKPPPPPNFDDCRVYYDDTGKILDYCVTPREGKYISITKEQYLQARYDAVVRDGKLVYTHNRRSSTKYERNSTGDVRTSKYDIAILVDDTEPEYALWKLTTYDE